MVFVRPEEPRLETESQVAPTYGSGAPDNPPETSCIPLPFPRSARSCIPDHQFLLPFPRSARSCVPDHLFLLPFPRSARSCVPDHQFLLPFPRSARSCVPVRLFSFCRRDQRCPTPRFVPRFSTGKRSFFRLFSPFRLHLPGDDV